MQHSLRPSWVDAAADIGGAAHVKIVGHLPFTRAPEFEELYRPRDAYAPGEHEVPDYFHDLYNLATNDLKQNGIDAQSQYLFLLAHAGTVAPGNALRADFWHVDLERLHRFRDRDGRIPVAINYAMGSDLPTSFATPLPAPLPAWETIRHPEKLNALGEEAGRLGHVFQASAGDVVRYDTLTLHRGTANTGDKPVWRQFLHIAFSPVRG